jgi:hypothetical protein
LADVRTKRAALPPQGRSYAPNLLTVLAANSRPTIIDIAVLV